MIRLIGIFSFKCMKRLGIAVEFVIMTQMLFLGAPIYILVNGQTTRDFAIEHGMQQGCPLAPYLFLIVGQTFNLTVLKELKGKIHNVKFFGSNKQQLIVQYANNTSFTIRTFHKDLTQLMHILQLFSRTSGLFIIKHTLMSFLLKRKVTKGQFGQYCSIEPSLGFTISPIFQVCHLVYLQSQFMQIISCQEESDSRLTFGQSQSFHSQGGT